MGVGLKSNPIYSTLILILVAAVAAVCVPNANAGRLELRNELKGLKGQDRVLKVKCWSSHDQLGLTNIMPGRSKNWSFRTVKLWPLAYTEFRCEFWTAFGLTNEQNVVVFKADTAFLWECDRPDREECTWVAKNDGLYLRTRYRAMGHRFYTFKDVVKSTWGRKTYLSGLN